MQFIGPPITDTDIDDPNTTTDSFKLNFNFHMNDGSQQEIKEKLEKLRKERNKLVHHFTERFDLSNSKGCNDAIAELDKSYQLIDEHIQELLVLFARILKLRQEIMPIVIQTLSSIIGVIPLGGVILWPLTPIVEELQSAEVACGKKGWTCLNEAIQHIKTTQPNIGPKKYHCSSWRQVLNRSGLFAIEKRPGCNKGSKEVWYRTKLTSEE